MKIVIVASSPDCNTANLQTLLQASGLQAARPSAKYGHTASDWHSKIYTALDHDIDGLTTQSPLPVGIAWLDLAVDLMVSNIDQVEWGFADARATWLLDFWRNVDPQSRFVLAYTPPQHLDLSSPQALNTWLSYSGELLRFYKANKARAILVDNSEVGIYPARLAYTCQKTWSLTTVDWQKLGTVAASAPPNTYGPVPSVAAKLGKLLHQSRTPLLNPSTAVMSTKKSGKPQGMLGALFALFGKSKQLSEDLDRAQAELAQTNGQLSQANLLLSDLGQEKENLQTQAQDLQTQISSLQAQAQTLQAERQTLQAQISALQTQNQAQSQEGELLLSQLHQVQEELERYALQNKQVQEQLAKTVAAEAALKAQLDNVTQALEAKSNDLAARAKELVDAQAAAQTASAAAQAAAVKAKQEAQAALNAVKVERDKQAQLLQQAQAKHQDSAQENELVISRLMQVQEELEIFYLQKAELEKLDLAYKSRWDRLATRLPNYFDFGSIDIVNVDTLSDIPSITWHVYDYEQPGVSSIEFSFVTVLQDGHSGIGLHKDGKPQAFVPKLLNTDKDHLATFLALSTTEFRQLTAAVSILAQLDAGQWQGFVFPPQFDLGFWRASLQTLIAQLKTLPALLRYDDVRLKRELINPDYEHLWLEFHGLSLGTTQLKKFEIRLGAALVQANGFSQYPKFEIPLIDGKTKPFESWYAESHDDSGAKLELRFSLDKNAFDVAVWSKLADADKALLARVIYAIPDALKRLDAQKVSIHRSWATWVNFATDAVRVLERNRPEPAKLAPSAAPKLQPPAAAAPQAAAPQAEPPSKPLAPLPAEPKAADKVIHIAPTPVPSKYNMANGLTTKQAKQARRAKA
jgi:hypothetical protein